MSHQTDIFQRPVRGSYNTHTHKVVPKDAVVLDLDEFPILRNPSGMEHWSRVVQAERPGIASFFMKLDETIKAQTKPPRIPEPGLYKIIEAGPDWHRRKWVRGPKGWTNVDAEGQYLKWSHWDSLENPRLIES